MNASQIAGVKKGGSGGTEGPPFFGQHDDPSVAPVFAQTSHGNLLVQLVRFSADGDAQMICLTRRVWWRTVVEEAQAFELQNGRDRIEWVMQNAPMSKDSYARNTAWLADKVSAEPWSDEEKRLLRDSAETTEAIQQDARQLTSKAWALPRANESQKLRICAVLNFRVEWGAENITLSDAFLSCAWT